MAIRQEPDRWFLTPGDIHVKVLPDGDPVRITDDSRSKYGLAFSPDGTRLAYTVAAWKTYVVSPLGGSPTLFLDNASGVTWLDAHRIVFSEVSLANSVHMGVVTAMEDRFDRRPVYFPRDSRGMVHLSYPSPDQCLTGRLNRGERHSPPKKANGRLGHDPGLFARQPIAVLLEKRIPREAD